MTPKTFTTDYLKNFTAERLLSIRGVGIEAFKIAYNQLRRDLIEKDTVIDTMVTEANNNKVVHVVGNPTDEVRYATQQRAVDLFLRMHTMMLDVHYDYRCSYEITMLSHYVHRNTANQMIIIEYTLFTSGRDTTIKDKAAYYYNNMGQEIAPIAYVSNEWLKVDEK